MQEARNCGFQPGLQCTQDVLAAALADLWLDRDLLEYALAAIILTDEAQRDSFSKLYKRFWRQQGSKLTDSTTYRNQKKVVKSSKNIAVMLGQGNSENQEAKEAAKTTSGASLQDSLKQTDFKLLSLQEGRLLDELADKLVREMSLRIKRRKKKASRGSIDIAQSIRKNLQNGGNIIALARQHPKREKFRLLILLDISGSMDKYSFYLLKFLWALRSHFSHIEAFAFSTKLMRITDYLSGGDLGASLEMVSRYVTHWSSGTKIGASLKDFNEQYAKRYLNGKTVTIILSDGLDTGEPEILAEAVQKIKLRSKKLVWLNPLKGMAGYQPIQRGMAAALPSVEHFGAAHNFSSLLELENILADA